MATTITKLSKSKSNVQQWVGSELGDGDIIDVSASLGHKGTSLVVETGAADVVLAFNVVTRVRVSNASLGNPGPAQGWPEISTVLGRESLEVKTPITLTKNSVYTFDNDFAIDTIQVVTVSGDMKITIA